MKDWIAKHRQTFNRILILAGAIAGITLYLILTDIVAKERVQKMLGMNRPSPSAEECATAYVLDEELFDITTDLKFAIRAIIIALPDEIDVQGEKALYEGIGKTNELFKPAGISFEVDTVEIIRDEGAYYGLRHYKNFARKNDKPGVINVYIYPNFPAYTDEEIAEGQSDFHGAAVRIPSQALAIKSFYLNRTTLAHELGHCLGLFHIFEPDLNGEGRNLYSGDYVCDTRYFDQAEYQDITRECKYMGKALKNYSDSELRQLTCNIMGYSYDPCRNSLTDGQIERLRWVVQQSPRLLAAIR